MKIVWNKIYVSVIQIYSDHLSNKVQEEKRIQNKYKQAFKI